MSTVNPAVPTNDLTIGKGEDVVVPFVLGVRILTVAVGNPTVITTDGEHGFTTGDRVYPVGVVGVSPSLSGGCRCTVISPTSFSIPVNVTTAGAVGAVNNPLGD